MDFSLDYLEAYSEKISFLKIKNIVNERKKYLKHKGSEEYWSLIQNEKLRAQYKNYKKDTIILGRKFEIDSDEREKLEIRLKKFIPWRKGPFSIFGIDIDSEWQSNLKWNRVLPNLDNLENKIICDIGSNNGYYMFKMAESKPKLVVGFDPVAKYKFTFEYLQKIAYQPNIKIELLGFKHLTLFPNFFDIIFCMGIVYHHRNPIEIFQNIFKALKPGGQLILESMGIPGDESLAIFPEDKFAGMRNVWFVPTESCLRNWLLRTHFQKVCCLYNEELNIYEQRATKWSPFKSLENSLGREKHTIEGYSRPHRIYFTARK